MTVIGGIISLNTTVTNFLWSNELALAASRYLEDMSGCALNPDYISFSGSTSKYIDKLATYSDHDRIAFVMERNAWETPAELIFDLALADNYASFRINKNLVSNWFNEIGIACNCHPIYEMICIFEFGTNVNPIVKTNPINK